MSEEDIEEIREQVKVVIKYFEIMYEELEKTNLPDDVKKALLLQNKTNN